MDIIEFEFLMRMAYHIESRLIYQYKVVFLMYTHFEDCEVPKAYHSPKMG